ncbi:ROK family protein [Streptomyces sp. SID3343]|uniref:ROK family protein n=1 Tax=Streptomyces sp. SID3343 TaxID=2690260 RepID=UPI00136E03A9|nr:ROK family protein [Streptomyces sp. SID3343]MYW00923.1 ROK family protein [Streptomyces sp. SID3343]
MRAAPTQEDIRRQNLGALLRHVHVLGPTSRAQLTAGMGLNRSTIGALTADLAAAGLVVEELPRDTGGRGRPSLVVRAQSQRVYVFACVIGVDRVVAARVGLGGVVLDRRELQRPGSRFSPKEVAEALGGFVGQMRLTAPRDGVCVGAGVAVCAMVRRSDGTIPEGPTPDWRDEPLGERLSAAIGTVAMVGNDADLGVVAEHTRGAAVGCDDVIYLHGDVCIGGGILSAGRSVTGGDGYAGEVGHMVVNPDGLPCRCGSRGCWETEIGEFALTRGTAKHAIGGLADAAARGDQDAEEGLRRVGDWLGLGVANLVNILNPQMVVFGGTLREVYLATAAQVRSRLNRTSLAVTREHLKLRTAALGDDAPLYGAAELAFARLLENPLESGVEAASG